MAAPLFSPEVKTFIARKYLAGDQAPRDIVVDLKKDFGMDVTSAQLRQFLSRSGLSARKREVDQKTCAIVSSAGATAIAKERAETGVKHLERWAQQAIAAADKAFAAAVESGKIRDLAAAVAAASAAVRLFHTCSGIEPAAKPAQTFNYSFSTIVVPPAPEVVAELPTDPGTGSQALEM